MQKGAPVKLLIGTDLQPELGFLFLQTELGKGGPAKDLLQEKAWAVSEVLLLEPNPEESLPQPAPVVHLIQATRLPARHVKLVRARVDAERSATPTLFEPAESMLGERGLVMDSSLTEPDQEQRVILAIHNPSREPVHLQKGQVLGQLQEATVLTADATDGSTPGVDPGLVGAVAMENGEVKETPDLAEVSFPPTDRVERVRDALQLSEANLSGQEKAELEMLIAEYAHLFALDPSELGATDVVTHSIDTGDHPPFVSSPGEYHLLCEEG